MPVRTSLQTSIQLINQLIARTNAYINAYIIGQSNIYTINQSDARINVPTSVHKRPYKYLYEHLQSPI